MNQDTADRVAELLEEQTRALAAVTGARTVRCPVCSVLVRDRMLPVHARAYDDDAHRVLEVMES